MNPYITKYKEILTLNILMGKERGWAEEVAYNHALHKWMDDHHTKGDSRFCLECGRKGTEQSPLLPWGVPPDQWIHGGDCWAKWYDKKIDLAVEELEKLGLPPTKAMSNGEYDYDLSMSERQRVDAIIVATEHSSTYSPGQQSDLGESSADQS